MPKINSNGIQIAYQRSGTGIPLVLIAGVGYGSWFWHKLVPLLEDQFEVITFDNRGSGESDKPPGPYTVPMMAADTNGLLDALDIAEAYIFGHSLGGFIAQEMAVSRPDLLGKLVLASTNHGGQNVIPITSEALQVLTNRDGEPMELIKRGITIATAPGFADNNPQIVQELIKYRFTNPVPAEQYQAQVMAGAGMATLTNEQVIERMASIKVPVLIMFGEHDQVVPPDNAQMMADKLPNASIHILPQVGHIFPIENPPQTAEVIVEFFTH
jgi:pimeloyl-ACP methyl ester carboxylesterase